MERGVVWCGRDLEEEGGVQIITGPLMGDNYNSKA